MLVSVYLRARGVASAVFDHVSRRRPVAGALSALSVTPSRRTRSRVPLGRAYDVTQIKVSLAMVVAVFFNALWSRALCFCSSFSLSLSSYEAVSCRGFSLRVRAFMGPLMLCSPSPYRENRHCCSVRGNFFFTATPDTRRKIDRVRRRSAEAALDPAGESVRTNRLSRLAACSLRASRVCALFSDVPGPHGPP